MSDRVELTDTERKHLVDSFSYPTGAGGYTYEPMVDDGEEVFAAVESIVASRTEALTAERDAQLAAAVRLEARARAERDALRAELTAANARCAELEGYVQSVAGGALVEEAETTVRRIHAEVERDMARQALTSADDMNRWWDEINAERDRLNTENAALQARLDAANARNELLEQDIVLAQEHVDFQAVKNAALREGIAKALTLADLSDSIHEPIEPADLRRALAAVQAEGSRDA